MAGMIAVVAAQLDPAAGITFDGLGFGLALGAALSQAVFVSISRDGYRAVPTGQAMAFILTVTVVLCVLLALATGGGPALARPLVDPGLLPLMLFTGLFAAAIPSLAFLTGIRWIGGMRAGILMLFEPVVGVALAAWLLSEPLQPVQAAGGAAILAAAIILQRSARAESTAPVPAPDGRDDRDRRDGAEPVDDDLLSLRVPGGP
jgi:drug/metabolite transporter (DMT)-like permease